MRKKYNNKSVIGILCVDALFEILFYHYQKIIFVLKRFYKSINKFLFKNIFIRWPFLKQFVKLISFVTIVSFFKIFIYLVLLYFIVKNIHEILTITKLSKKNLKLNSSNIMELTVYVKDNFNYIIKNENLVNLVLNNLLYSFNLLKQNSNKKDIIGKNYIRILNFIKKIENYNILSEDSINYYKNFLNNPL